MDKLNDIQIVMNGVTGIYAGEKRSWWDSVDESQIEMELMYPDFISFVNDIYQSAVYGYSVEVAN